VKELASLPPKAAQACLAVCDYVDRRSSLFKIAVFFLPPEKRLAARITYGFFRHLDDMADREHISLADFRAWREQAEKGIDQQTDPFITAWSYVREACQLDPRLANDRLDGIEMDIRGQRYQTFDDLLSYCHCVAVSGAFMALPILGLRPGCTLADIEKPLEDLALAVQLTDILWDIDEDLAKGRIYLPEEILDECGLTYQDIENRVYDERFRAMMWQLVWIARRYFRTGWPAIKCFRPAERLAASFGSTVFLKALDRIQQNDYDIYSKRVRFSMLEKVWLLLRCLPEYFGIVR
jgi:phytoene synthase